MHHSSLTRCSFAFDPTSPPSTALTASLTINYTGDFTVTVTEGIKNPQTLHNAPFQVTVRPAQTDPAACDSFFPSTITAGKPFTAETTPFDSFSNPTFYPDDSFSAYFDTSPSTLFPLTRSPNSFTFSFSMPIASSYKLHVIHVNSGNEIANSPFHFDVKPAAADAATTTHNIKEELELVSSKDTLLELRVLPKDQYNNTITAAAGYALSIDGETHELFAPDFSFSHSIEAGFSGDVTLSFTLDGFDIKDSPITIKVEPPPTNEISPATIFGIVAAFLSLLIGGSFFFHRNKKKGELQEELAVQRESRLQHMNSDLQESLRKKKHSDVEIEVMKKAMEELDSARKDELEEVLIPSAEVKVDRLLGKGGFGVVNLASYNGQLVAMKQLLTINVDSVKRFRFECFLMKNLRHPNIVKLIGVCWDSDTFACCLEFVENGSLEDWLRKARDKDHNLISWKKHLVMTAIECALGVQYLHNEQYWAEEEEVEDTNGEIKIVPAGYRQCIIHRDLKPDNMLLTKDWQLKLTDFGEARAVQLNQTMTSVGTPIYVAPEVMKGYRYSATADTYSFGICLVAMIRADKNIMEFYFQALRKSMKRKSMKGCGITILNTRVYTKGWRPLLPVNFKKAYTRLDALIERCWSQVPEERPLFDEIVRLMQGDIAEEIRRKDEPEITYLSKEDDSLFFERLGVDEVFEDDGEEGMDTRKMVSQRVHTETLETLEKKERMHAETLEKKDAVIKELQAQIKTLTV